MSVTVTDEDGNRVDVEVEIHSVEPGGRHCAPSVDWSVVGELPDGVYYSDVESQVLDQCKYDDSNGYRGYYR